jgi:hypothetical protein
VEYGEERCNLEVQNSISHTQFLDTVHYNGAEYIGLDFTLEDEDCGRKVSD